MGETTNEQGTGATAAAGSNQGGTPPAPAAPEEKIERVDLSKSRSVATSAPMAPAEPVQKPAPSAAVFKNEQEDIARILGGIKLPERNSPAAPQREAPSRTYDTSLATDPKKKTAEQAEKKERIREAARAVTDSLPVSAPKMSDDVRALHTLKDDLQDVVRNKKISLVRAVALEEEKRHRPTISSQEEAAAARPARRTSFPFLVTLVLFLAGAGALGGTYYVLNDRAMTTQAPLTSQVLFAEQAVPLPLEGLAAADIRREIANARNAATLTLGAILQIVPVQSAQGAAESLSPVDFGDFMQAIGAHPPEELVRALSSEFFFGIHTVDENAPVFVIPVTSYERAFAGMLAWEKTMNTDLAPMFTAVPMQTVGADGVLVERKFGDTVIRNYDVRILKDEGGTIQLYYSFPTRNILIIAESQYSFTELLSRLRADRRL